MRIGRKQGSCEELTKAVVEQGRWVRHNYGITHTPHSYGTFFLLSPANFDPPGDGHM